MERVEGPVTIRSLTDQDPNIPQNLAPYPWYQSDQFKQGV